MNRHLATALIAGALLLGAAPPAAAGDAEEVRAVISEQLAAFKAGDADGAYAHAAPGIRALYPDPDQFMAMVERGYGAVYRSSMVSFGALEAEGDLLRQEVRLSDPRGAGHVATYILQRQADGTLAIAAVVMRRSNDIAA